MRKVRALPAPVASLVGPGPAFPDLGPRSGAQARPLRSSLPRGRPGVGPAGSRPAPAAEREARRCGRGRSEADTCPPPRPCADFGRRVAFLVLSENLPEKTKTGREPSFCETQAGRFCGIRQFGAAVYMKRGRVSPLPPELRKLSAEVSISRLPCPCENWLCNQQLCSICND